MHILSLFWKILFAFIPPTEYWNGWACFIVSISVIGFLTAIIGDLASHFGCTVGLRDTVTAVVFVALGTSLPGKWPTGWQRLIQCIPDVFAQETLKVYCVGFIFKLRTFSPQIPLPVKSPLLRTSMQMHVWEMWPEAMRSMCFWALGWPGP